MRVLTFLVVVLAGVAAQWLVMRDVPDHSLSRPERRLALPVYYYGSIYPEVRREAVESPPVDFRALDEFYHPGETVSLAQVVVERAQHRIDAYGGSLDRSEFELVLELAGWPEDLRREAASVAWCESRWSPYAVGDGGNSLGLFQLWSGWFPWAGYRPDQWADALINARVALAVLRRDVALGRPRWTQWSCKP